MFEFTALILLLLIAVLTYAATRPDRFRVERSLAIRAPAATIFAYLDDLRRWEVWSPWLRKDPAMRQTYSGPASGTGAAYEWDGNRAVGAGRLEITESLAPSRMTMHLEFRKPFTAHNTSEFVLEPEGEWTRVRWCVHGPMPFISKLVGVFLDTDKMCGRDFEAGLANLRAAAEE